VRTVQTDRPTPRETQRRGTKCPTKSGGAEDHTAEEHVADRIMKNIDE
jgi:hypothetical protein